MTYLVDRRCDGRGKSIANRQRFLKRYREQIKRSVSDNVSERSIADTKSGSSVSIPKQDMEEPLFNLGSGGVRERVFTGNKSFQKGDKIKRPEGGGQGEGGGGDASDSGSGEDEFVFQLTREEFLQVLFDQLELPNLIKQHLNGSKKWKYIHGGISSDGTPNRINIVRTFRSAHARRIARAGARQERIDEIEQQLQALALTETSRREELSLELQELLGGKRSTPFIDDLDVRYNITVKKSEPNCRAVMICMMDVSGSMDEKTKDIAKRFYILLYLFLQQHYEMTEVVFIRHHTEAKEVNEQEFFYARETGGTVVSSALELASKIIEERYPPDQWNIYAAQASDGDNWGNDDEKCLSSLQHDLLPVMQHFFYVEIGSSGATTLWQTYERIDSEGTKNLSKQQIGDYREIYPVFRRFFEKKVS